MLACPRCIRSFLHDLDKTPARRRIQERTARNGDSLFFIIFFAGFE